MIYDLYKNRTEKDVSQTIKDSIHKCTDAAVFLEKINRDILNLRREKIALELNQLIFIKSIDCLGMIFLKQLKLANL